MSEPKVSTRYDLGSVIQCTNQYGAIVYIFGNDVAVIEPRITGVFVYLRGMNEEIWIGGGDTPEQTTKLAEKFTSVVGSIRLNGVDKV